MKQALKCLLFGVWLTPIVSLGAIIGPKENRMTYQSYMNRKMNGHVDEFYRTYSGAGVFWCNDSFESASVVRKNTILVLAAHSVFARDSAGKCAPVPNLDKCYFQVINPDGKPGKRTFVKPETLRASRDMDCEFTRFSTDWAVMRLQDAAEGVVPFPPFDVRGSGSMHDGFQRLTGTKIISMAGRNENFKGHDSSTPSICEDTIGYVWPMQAPSGQWTFGMGIGCSSGKGVSGGAILYSENQMPAFLGLTTFGASADKDYRPFDNNNFTGGPLLQGEFYETLMGM